VDRQRPEECDRAEAQAEQRAGNAGYWELGQLRIRLTNVIASEAKQSRIGREIASAPCGRLAMTCIDHFFSLYPVRNIHHTIARQTARNTSVIARLIDTLTSATPKKLQRKPLIR